MKKYKLIKEYPGSPNLGHIAKFEKDKWYCHMTPKLQGSDDELHSLGCAEVKLYPEFWEEIIEKSYEIISLCTNSYFGITNSQLDIDSFKKNAIGTEKYTIHSVKRLSDDEVFTIGDKVDHIPIKDLPHYKSVVIEKFIISGDKIEVFGQFNIGMSGFIYLEYLSKTKIPLFQTEDGVDVFEGDTFYIVDNWIPIIYVNYVSINEYIHNLKFSTKEKAEEYIIMNKPCLSLNDVAKVYVSAGFEITNRNKKHPYIKQQLQLRELIKTKLKKAL